MTSGVVTALKTPFVPSVALGRGLGLEGFPLSARLDVNLETLSYVHVLPASGAWSPDGRWAVIGPMAVSYDPCAAPAEPSP
jgi:hypothetical protein